MNLQLRGISASPLLKLAAEPRPPMGFTEQRSSVAGAGSVMGYGEEVDEPNSAAAQAVAAILADLTELDITMSSSFSEMLDVSVIICRSSCWELTKYVLY